MDPLFRNFLLFLSGFIMALVVIKSPLRVANKNSSTMALEQDFDEESIRFNTKPLKHFKDSVSDLKPRAANNNILQTSSKTQNPYYSYSKPSLEAPTRPAINNDQVPTAPPTGRTEEENKDDTTDVANNEAEKLFGQNLATENKAQSSNSSSRTETDLSSTAQYVGAITAVDSTSDKQQQVVRRTGGGGSNGRGTAIRNNEDNPALGTIPSEFTTAGLQTAKSLLSKNSISEIEYLDYLSLGLESTDSVLKTSAINETVGLKSRNAFLLQTQFANSSAANLEATSSAISTQYRSVSDLNFLSQMISDTSSIEAQNWAVQSLAIVLSSSSIDFTNQQVRDTLVGTVYDSLVQLDPSHPAFPRAQIISVNINEELSS